MKPIFKLAGLVLVMLLGAQATYRIYEYRDGKISYRTQYIRMDYRD